MQNKMEEAADANLEKMEQQQTMKRPIVWSMDLTFICGDGNGQNALKVAREVNLINDKI
jgi:hypothetical protein